MLIHTDEAGSPGPVGTVLVLNGTSSSGKSCLGGALQEAWRGPLLDAGLDRHLWSLPRRYRGAEWPQVFRYELDDDGKIASVVTGPVGRLLLEAMHRAVAASAKQGLDVLVDHVLLEHGIAVDLAETLVEVPAAFIGVRCPVDVLNQREVDRADRTVGQAAAQHRLVHAHGGYDLEVDTSILSPEQAAHTVLAWLADGPEFTALDRLRSG